MMAAFLRNSLLHLGRERITRVLCVIASLVAFAYQYRQLDDPALHDLVAPVVLAIAVPILYLTPLVWLLFRYLIRPTYENENR
ncbi:MAG: hypothetical protein LBO79_00980 [Zoogloeaceae bacterium]|jgi:uncharacterized membrane protein|nr:hypothetical protein [Zoogloeaceae bacterium]